MTRHLATLRLYRARHVISYMPQNALHHLWIESPIVVNTLSGGASTSLKPTTRADPPLTVRYTRLLKIALWQTALGISTLGMQHYRQ